MNSVPYPKVGHPYTALLSVARAAVSAPQKAVTATRPTPAAPITPAKPAAKIAPTAPVAAKTAATPTVPVPLSAAQRAALDAQRRQQAEAEAARRKAAEQQAAERRQAEIAETWRQAHARVRDPYGHHDSEAKQAETSKDENYGWAVIHATIRQMRGY